MFSIACDICRTVTRLAIGSRPLASKVVGSLICRGCRGLIQRIDVSSWSQWVDHQVRWKRSQQNVGALRSRRQAVRQSDADIDRDGLAAELAACLLLCPAYLDTWRADREDGGPNRGNDLPATWTGLDKPVEIKQTRYRDARTGYLVVRPPAGTTGPILPEHIDDSVYILLVGGPWAFEAVGWADRELLLTEGEPNPSRVRQGQQECLGLHWTQLYRACDLPSPKLTLAGWSPETSEETPGWLTLQEVRTQETVTPWSVEDGESPMATTWELNVKPSFLTDLLALPNKKVARQIQEKVEDLQRDPRPDGHTRKKLKSRKNPVFRLRVGDYRLLYTFGTGWIRLLGIHLHHQGYDDESIDYEEPKVVPSPAPNEPTEDAVLLGVPTASISSAKLTPSAAVMRPLPRPLTAQFLRELQVPSEYHALLESCTDEKNLLDVAVPEDVLLRILEGLFPQTVEQVLQQPDLVLDRSEDLVRFAEGQIGLKDFLLRLDPDQEKAVDWGTKGPLLIKGGPGVGKSITLLYRVRSLLHQARQEGRPLPRILLTTYTKALCRFSEQLLAHLLEPGELRQVTIQNADKLSRYIAQRHGKLADKIATEHDLQKVLRKVREQTIRSSESFGPKPLARIRDDYLIDEFAWVIEGRGITKRQMYLEADRTGRGVRLSAKERDDVWNLFKVFRKQLDDQHYLSWGQVRGRAWTLVKDGKHARQYDAVLIDEAQDLTPVGLGLLVELCKSPEGVCLTADANQSLYSRGFTWKHVHEGLKFAGRTVLLKRNYRTTQEITSAAAAFLAAGGGEDAESLIPNCSTTGSKPLLQGYKNMGDMTARLAGYLRSCCLRQRLKFQTAAVLTPTNQAGMALAESLNDHGLPARFMTGDALDLDADVVKILTLHSAKGLEFPTVVVTGLVRGELPRVLRNSDPDEQKEQERYYRRLLFVGMTRAMQNLLVMYSEDRPSPFVASMDDSHWSRATAGESPRS